jgi:hypothetical protein
MISNNFLKPLAYVYILFYSMIKEADMRLSSAVSVY